MTIASEPAILANDAQRVLASPREILARDSVSLASYSEGLDTKLKIRSNDQGIKGSRDQGSEGASRAPAHTRVPARGGPDSDTHSRPDGMDAFASRWGIEGDGAILDEAPRDAYERRAAALCAATNETWGTRFTITRHRHHFLAAVKYATEADYDDAWLVDVARYTAQLEYRHRGGATNDWCTPAAVFGDPAKLDALAARVNRWRTGPQRPEGTFAAQESPPIDLTKIPAHAIIRYRYAGWIDELHRRCPYPGPSEGRSLWREYRDDRRLTPDLEAEVRAHLGLASEPAAVAS